MFFVKRFSMGLSRNILLWASQNAFLRDTLPRYGFVRRAVRKFMPGEDVESALTAAEEMKQRGIPTIFTRLGENVATVEEANAVRDHYLEVLDKINARGLDTHVSTKLTQLGLDLDPELAFRNMLAITEKARRLRNMTWIDMESTPYVDITLDIYRRIHAVSDNVGVCLQSYLRRTKADLEALYPLAPAIRMVKGAYREPPEHVFEKKAEVDRSFLELCTDYLKRVDPDRSNLGYGTHDVGLMTEISAVAENMGLGKRAPEFQMLYGIKTEQQFRLAREGYKVRVLVAYGSYWFPWYMRRLAERPANVWFVVKNLFA
jgi:proline dehydrogenase